MRLKVLVYGVVAFLAFSTAGSSAVADRTFVANYENVMGTSLELKVGAVSQAVAGRAEDAVLAEIARQSHILSTWDPTSEVSQWARSSGQPVHVSRELFEVLDLFDQWRVRTHGALAREALVPDEWLEATPHLPDAQAVRTAYHALLRARLSQPQAWLPGRRG